jgi:hypothetical protein
MSKKKNAADKETQDLTYNREKFQSMLEPANKKPPSSKHQKMARVGARSPGGARLRKDSENKNKNYLDQSQLSGHDMEQKKPNRVPLNQKKRMHKAPSKSPAPSKKN